MDKLPFFELEELLDSLKALIEQEEEERKKNESGHGASSMTNMNPSSIARQMTSSMPKMPNIKM